LYQQLISGIIMSPHTSLRTIAALILFSGIIAAPAYPVMAQEEYAITIKDHQFSPAELAVPAGQKIKVTITNNDASPEEFESHDLNREVMVNGNSSASVVLGPLKAGSYSYVGEFHEDVAKGTIVAK
jgi:plastocyanin